MATEVLMPKLGLNMSEGLLVDWLKKEGDPVRNGDPLFVVETDKITIESEAVSDGILGKILVPAGETVSVATVVAWIVAEGEEIPQVQEKADPGEKVQHDRSLAKDKKVQASSVSKAPAGRVLASPVAKRLAREHGLDLAKIKGSGRDGKISQDDVLAAAAAAEEKISPETERIQISPVAKKLALEGGLDLAQISGTGRDGRITRDDVEKALDARQESSARPAGVAIPIRGMRAVIAERMALSSRETAAVTLHSQVDASGLVKYRADLKTKSASTPSYNAILAAIAARSLRVHPQINARLEGDTILLLDDINIGVAVDTDQGLVVVVLRDAAEKLVGELGVELQALSERALAGKAQLDDVTGGTFTITNLGGFGIDNFTPVINPPEIAILGVGRIMDTPVVVDGVVVVRPQIGLSLTFDHRLVDGAPAARFLKQIADSIGDPVGDLG
jgi:pyruvate dehydrogenase E2 component (dihydrolipoamide acetyltransferase)